MTDVTARFYRMRLAVRRKALEFVASLLDLPDAHVQRALSLFSERPGLDRVTCGLIRDASIVLRERVAQQSDPHSATADILRVRSELLSLQRQDFLSWALDLVPASDLAIIVPTRWRLLEYTLPAALAGDRSALVNLVSGGDTCALHIDTVSASILAYHLHPAAPGVIYHLMNVLNASQEADMRLADYPPLSWSELVARRTVPADVWSCLPPVVPLPDMPLCERSPSPDRSSPPSKSSREVALWMYNFGPPSYRHAVARRAKAAIVKEEREKEREARAIERRAAARRQLREAAQQARVPSRVWHHCVLTPPTRTAPAPSCPSLYVPHRPVPSRCRMRAPVRADDTSSGDSDADDRGTGADDGSAAAISTRVARAPVLGGLSDSSTLSDISSDPDDDVAPGDVDVLEATSPLLPPADDCDDRATPPPGADENDDGTGAAPARTAPSSSSSTSSEAVESLCDASSDGDGGQAPAALRALRVTRTASSAGHVGTSAGSRFVTTTVNRANGSVRWSRVRATAEAYMRTLIAAL